MLWYFHCFFPACNTLLCDNASPWDGVVAWSDDQLCWLAPPRMSRETLYLLVMFGWPEINDCLPILLTTCSLPSLRPANNVATSNNIITSQTRAIGAIFSCDCSGELTPEFGLSSYHGYCSEVIFLSCCLVEFVWRVWHQYCWIPCQPCREISRIGE